MTCAAPLPMTRHQSGIQYPRALENDRYFQVGLDSGRMGMAGMDALARAVGLRNTTIGFERWAEGFLSGYAGLEQLYIGRCTRGGCRMWRTNYESPHECYKGKRVTRRH